MSVDPSSSLPTANLLNLDPSSVKGLVLSDSHCHLEMIKDINEDALLNLINSAGVKWMNTICTKISEFDKAHAFTRYDGVYCSVGIHPCSVRNESLEDLEKYITAPKVSCIGETGLDFYHDDTPETKIIQEHYFRYQLELARKYSLPVQIHCRKAEDEIIDILREEMSKPGLGEVIIHCFTSPKEYAPKFLEIGCYISFAGVVTFKNATDILQASIITDATRILIETDSPYLSPHPFRGKQNNPSLLPYTAQKIAQARGICVEELADITTSNFKRIFLK